MPVLWPPSPPVFLDSGEEEAQLRSYAIYYDLFDEVLAAGSVDGTDSTDELALRDVYDTGSNLNLNNQLELEGAVSAGDPGLWHETLVPAAWVTWNGYAHLWEIKNDAGETEFGLDVDKSAGLADHLKILSEELFVNGDGPTLDVTAGVTMSFLVVRRDDSAGYLYLYRTGTDDWKLFWMDDGPLISA